MFVMVIIQQLVVSLSAINNYGMYLKTTVKYFIVFCQPTFLFSTTIKPLIIKSVQHPIGFKKGLLLLYNNALFL